MSKRSIVAFALLNTVAFNQTAYSSQKRPLSQLETSIEQTAQHLKRVRFTADHLPLSMNANPMREQVIDVIDMIVNCADSINKRIAFIKGMLALRSQSPAVATFLAEHINQTSTAVNNLVDFSHKLDPSVNSLAAIANGPLENSPEQRVVHEDSPLCFPSRESSSSDFDSGLLTPVS